VLHGEATELDGVSFFGLGGGVPVTPWDWSFDLTEDEAEAKLAGCPDDSVLVVHSPPKGYLDGRDLGSEAVLRTIERTQPRLAVCGHIHECWREEAAIGRTRVVNLGPEGVLLDVRT
jgi:Icc-related predicted phosphoesterase